MQMNDWFRQLAKRSLLMIGCALLLQWIISNTTDAGEVGPIVVVVIMGAAVWYFLVPLLSKIGAADKVIVDEVPQVNNSIDHTPFSRQSTYSMAMYTLLAAMLPWVVIALITPVAKENSVRLYDLFGDSAFASGIVAAIPVLFMRINMVGGWLVSLRQDTRLLLVLLVPVFTSVLGPIAGILIVGESLTMNSFLSCFSIQALWFPVGAFALRLYRGR
jgi:hypothetical protein